MESHAVFPLIPLLITAGSWIANQIAQRRAAKKEAQYNLQTQTSLNQQAFDQNKQMWNLQNKYNSPASQMARFSEAGLNPNLIYSQGSAGNASQAPTIQPAQSNRRFPVVDLPDMIGTFQNFQAKKTQIDLHKSQIDMNNQKIQTEAVKRMNELLKNQRGKFDLDLAQELRKYNVDIRSNESASARIKASMAAKQFQLLDQFGEAEKVSRLKSQALQQARTVVGTASEKERLELMKQFGWQKGYEESAMRRTKVMSQEQQADFDKLKTALFREHQLTPQDNIFLRWFLEFLNDENIPVDSIAYPPR